ncbi:MAG: metallophosphoesterase [Flavobacteriales bacterium]|nr:metallophosphoesterase [Flavobacteriales bacterium]
MRHSHIGKRSEPVLFTFAHITDTHIGERAEGRDFGTPGFLNDTLTGTESGYTIDRLRSTMRHFGDLQQAERPAFIIHSGDLTDSGERSELLMARQLMEGPIPCIPLMGNHDAWPYNRFATEAATACGDSLMNAVFADVFDSLQQRFDWVGGTRTARFTCPVSSNSAFLQNYAFIYSGVRFVFLDFNPRYHVKKDEPGIGPEAYLTDTEGGTVPFLRQQLAVAQMQGEQVVLIVHHPPVTAVVGKRFAFSKADKQRLAEILRPHSTRVLGWFCGHLHRWARYRFSKAGIPVFETKAVKKARHGAIRLVSVHGAEK